MLWREPYETRIERGVAYPAELEFEVVIGGFSLESDGERQIWARLIQGDFGGDARYGEIVIRTPWTPDERSELEAVTAPSRLFRTRLLEDPGGLWHQLVKPDKPSRAFAAILPLSLLMVGPPTGSAWEEFAEGIRSMDW